MIAFDSGWLSDMPSTRAASAFVYQVDKLAPNWAKPFTIYATHTWLHETGHARSAKAMGLPFEFETGGASAWSYLFRNPFSPAGVESPAEGHIEFVGAGFNSTMAYAERHRGDASFWSVTYARLDAALYFNRSKSSDRAWLAREYRWSEKDLALLTAGAWLSSLPKGAPQSYVYFGRSPSVRTWWTENIATEIPLGGELPELTLARTFGRWRGEITLAKQGVGAELRGRWGGVRWSDHRTISGQRAVRNIRSSHLEVWVTVAK